jgi:hypothetical protein
MEDHQERPAGRSQIPSRIWGTVLFWLAGNAAYVVAKLLTTPEEWDETPLVLTYVAAIAMFSVIMLLLFVAADALLGHPVRRLLAFAARPIPRAIRPVVPISIGVMAIAMIGADIGSLGVGKSPPASIGIETAAQGDGDSIPAGDLFRPMRHYYYGTGGCKDLLGDAHVAGIDEVFDATDHSLVRVADGRRIGSAAAYTFKNSAPALPEAQEDLIAFLSGVRNLKTRVIQGSTFQWSYSSKDYTTHLFHAVNDRVLLHISGYWTRDLRRASHEFVHAVETAVFQMGSARECGGGV